MCPARWRERYLAFLETRFHRRAGRAADEFDLYVLWNGGSAYYERIGFAPARVRPAIRERARRFVNLRGKSSGASGVAALVEFVEALKR